MGARLVIFEVLKAKEHQTLKQQQLKFRQITKVEKQNQGMTLCFFLGDEIKDGTKIWEYISACIPLN